MNIKKHNTISSRGMTLVELVVVLSIFIIVSGITIFEYQGFRSSASLQNLADDIALSIRKAQSFAIGVRNTTNANFESGYGVHFSVHQNQTEPRAGSSKSFILFADMNQNKTYDFDSSKTTCSLSSVEPSHECAEVVTLNGAEAVTGIYVYRSGDTIGATDPRMLDPFGSLDIVFLRPEADAFFCYRSNFSSNPSDPCDISSSSSGGISHVRIELSNPNIPVVYNEDGSPAKNSGSRTITVWNTGQISIN